MGDIGIDIRNEALQYFKSETSKITNPQLNKFKARINTWLRQANLALANAELREKTFMTTNKNKEVVIRSAVGLGGGNARGTLETQFNTVQQLINDSSIFEQIEFQNYNILKEGYRILTELGEYIRQDKINYQIVLHDGGLGLTEGIGGSATSFTVGLDEFLDVFAVGSTYDLKLTKASVKSLKQRLANSTTAKIDDWSKNLSSFWLFAAQVHNFTQLSGSERLKPYAGVNEGNLLEAYLQSGGGFKAHWAPKGDDKYWPSLKKFIINLMHAVLDKPSPFWQGGESDTGNLKGIQVKGLSASITNLGTLTRQMIRIWSILNGVMPQWLGRINEKLGKFKLSENQIVNALGKMFDRNFKKNYSILLNF